MNKKIPLVQAMGRIKRNLTGMTVSDLKVYSPAGIKKPGVVLTPEIVRKLCRGLGGTKDLAGDLEEACQRVLNGDAYSDVLGAMWGEAEASAEPTLETAQQAPACTYCKHYYFPGGRAYCLKWSQASEVINPVNGATARYSPDEACFDNRQIGEKCGPKGSGFEPGNKIIGWFRSL